MKDEFSRQQIDYLHRVISNKQDKKIYFGKADYYAEPDDVLLEDLIRAILEYLNLDIVMVRNKFVLQERIKNENSG